MRGTNIAEVEGWWLLSNWPNHSVPKTQTTASRLMLATLYSSLPNSMRDPCDGIKWHHDCLLYLFSRKTTMHAQRKCLICLCLSWNHSQSLQLLFLHMNPLSFLYPQFCACDTLPQVFWCTLALEPCIYLSTTHTKTSGTDNCINNK